MLEQNQFYQFSYDGTSYVGVCKERFIKFWQHTSEHPICKQAHKASDSSGIFPSTHISMVGELLAKAGITYIPIPSYVLKVDAQRSITVVDNKLYMDNDGIVDLSDTTDILYKFLIKDENPSDEYYLKLANYDTVLYPDGSVTIGCTHILAAEMINVKNWIKQHITKPN